MEQKILIFGDICPDNDYRRLFDSENSGAFSDEIVEAIKDARLVIANFECPATDHTAAITKCGPSLRAEPKDIRLMKNLGFDVLSLANNHILDYGMQGVFDTLRFCEDEKILTVGAGKGTKDASQPIVCDVGDKKIGIISFAEAEFNLAREMTPGANHFDPYESYDQVVELRARCDYLIVLYHGGIEYYKNPSPILQKKCRKFVQAGADLVLCQHSHCIGTIEEIAGSTILYGQGNSLFGYRPENDTWNEGLVVVVTLEGSPQIEFKLLKATPNGVQFAVDAECNQRIIQMREDSIELNNPAWITEQWHIYTQRQAALNLPLLYGWSRIFIKLNRILRNWLINKRYSKRKLMTTMNLLRCEAHHEVIQTILEDKIF